jgi:2TM domain
MENSFEDQMRLAKARKKVKSIKGFYKHFSIYIIVNTVLLIMKYAQLEPGEDFFTWHNFTTAFAWGIGLLFHGVGVFGTDMFLGANWEERKIREYMDKRPDNTTKWE